MEPSLELPSRRSPRQARVGPSHLWDGSSFVAKCSLRHNGRGPGILPEAAGFTTIHATAISPPLSQASTSLATVLLVDDDPGTNHALSRALRAAGYHVISVYDGDQAFAAAADPPPVDLLVIDIQMPGLSGDGVAGRLRERSADLPVIFMTAGEFPDAARTMSGAFLLKKPFPLGALLYAAAAVLQPDTGSPPR